MGLGLVLLLGQLILVSRCKIVYCGGIVKFLGRGNLG